MVVTSRDTAAISATTDAAIAIMVVVVVVVVTVAMDAPRAARRPAVKPCQPLRFESH
jgi:hypothetical protein